MYARSIKSHDGARTDGGVSMNESLVLTKGFVDLLSISHRSWALGALRERLDMQHPNMRLLVSRRLTQRTTRIKESASIACCQGIWTYPPSC